MNNSPADCFSEGASGCGGQKQDLTIGVNLLARCPREGWQQGAAHRVQPDGAIDPFWKLVRLAPARPKKKNTYMRLENILL